MQNTQFEALMRTGEALHGQRLPDGSWVVVRVDGHGFSRLTAEHFQKPFDPKFHDCMVASARALLDEFGGIYAYTQSDEISLLLPRGWAMFDRSHEKTISLTAGLASAVFTQQSGHLARFDSRVWLSEETNKVLDYFRWRQSDGTRCAINGWCYWTLRQQGNSYADVTQMLEGKAGEWKLDLLQQHGIDFHQTPLWQQRGVGLFWETFEKQGFNPKTQQTVTATRRRIGVRDDLPTGEKYAEWLLPLMKIDEVASSANAELTPLECPE